jgi:hypothetical protein
MRIALPLAAVPGLRLRHAARLHAARYVLQVVCRAQRQRVRQRGMDSSAIRSADWRIGGWEAAATRCQQPTAGTARS